MLTRSLTMLRGLLVLSLAAWPLLPATAQSGVVEHVLSFPQRHNQYVHVTATFPAPEQQVELAIPAWTPGSYLIRDFAAHVENFRASGPDGQRLSSKKTAKSRWRIDTGGAPEVTVTYEVWAGELNVSTSWIESDFALINGAGVFMFSDAAASLPQVVRVELPAEWREVQTSLDRGESRGVFRARDFDELVDSPIVAGNPETFDFSVGNHPFALVLPNKNRFWDGSAASQDLSRLVAAHLDFWGSNPLEKKYLFINLFIGPRGGLEHDHSTVMMASGWSMRDKQEYGRWLGLVSHEFFHVWNVRRLRPAALEQYDYEQEVYTRELWLAEGLSSYYDDLLLFRSGLIEVADYLAALAKEIRNFEAMPGREVRSAELASFDTWIKQYKPNENSVNSTVSYYRKGAVIGFVTDTAIRRATNNSSSLDTVMRQMYSRYGPSGTVQQSYPPGAFEGLVEEVAGIEVRRLVESMLRSTDDPDIDGSLSWYGLNLDRALDATTARNKGDTPPAGFGVSWKLDGSKVLVEQVIRGNSGAEAGLLPGDELLALDGFRVDSGNYDSAINRLYPGEEVVLTLSRHGQLLELPVRAQVEIPESYLIYPGKRISRRQKSRLEAWLGRDLVFSN